MQTTEIIVTVTIHRCEQVRNGQARRRVGLRRWFARLNPWTVAWYALLTVAGVALFKIGAAYALHKRGCYTVGGEALVLLLPVLYYMMAATIRDVMRDAKDWQ